MTRTFDFTGEHVLVNPRSDGIGYVLWRSVRSGGRRVAVLVLDKRHRDGGDQTTRLRDGRLTALSARSRTAWRKRAVARSRVSMCSSTMSVPSHDAIDEPGEEVERMFDRIIDINVEGAWTTSRATC